ncbi:MAG: hypothetical protein LBR43_03500 [Spiroplasmataceae bacterium]|jgi:hypothetical protein|nr:hypothetical protein [Spiroplasmataceae bacterium]
MKKINNFENRIKILTSEVKGSERKEFVEDLKGIRKTRIIISKQEIRDCKFELARIRERIKLARAKIKGTRQEIKIINNFSLGNYESI